MTVCPILVETHQYTGLACWATITATPVRPGCLKLPMRRYARNTTLGRHQGSVGGSRQLSERHQCCRHRRAGRCQDCIDACGQLLCDVDARGATELEASALRLRARAALQLRRLAAAEADAAEALRAQSGDIPTLLLQAEVSDSADNRVP